jgi:hypothetical protein
VGGQRHTPVALLPGKLLVSIVQEAEWDPGPVWTGAESLAPTGVRFPDRSASSQSLYRLTYQSPSVNNYKASYNYKFIYILILFFVGNT